jgi:hypothetical protein
MKGSRAPTDHRYLLHVRHEGGATRNVSLRDVSDGRLRNFSGLPEMLSFLESQAADAALGGTERVLGAEDPSKGGQT